MRSSWALELITIERDTEYRRREARFGIDLGEHIVVDDLHVIFPKQSAGGDRSFREANLKQSFYQTNVLLFLYSERELDS